MVNFNTKFEEKRKEVQHGKFEHGELKLLLVNYVAI